MKVILVFVATLNGKITKGDNPEVRIWSSRSDQEYYSNIWKSSSLLVMGSNTFNLNVIKPAKGRLIIVLTSKPAIYNNLGVSGQLEFRKESPSLLVSEFREKGFDRMTVVGGAKVAASFLEENMVDELWLTLEPRIFGSGTSLISEGEVDTKLKLLSCEQVNDMGTLITRYAVMK